MTRQFLFRKLRLTSSLCLLGLMSSAALAASNAIEKIEFSQLSGEVLVKLTMRSPVAGQPSAFTIASPPRLAFDFPDTENSSGTNAMTAGIGALRSLNLVQAGERTRLVLNLSNASQYSLRNEGNALFISLPNAGSNPVPVASSAAPTQSQLTAAPTPQVSSFGLIHDVDFRADSSDLATVKISTSDANALLDVKQQGSNLVLMLPSNTLPEKLAKRLDVRDYGTPVELVTVSKSGQGTRLTLANKGDWDYNVRQLDNQIFVEVRRIVEDANNLANSKDVQGKVVSFNFTQPVPVSQMIGLFQDITGLNFMVMPGVSGEIQSLKMENTPADVAIDVISRMYGLGFRRYGNIVVVGKADDLAKYDKDEHDRAVTLANSEPIQQETFKIKYRTAGEIVQALTLNTAPGATASGAAATPAPAQPAAPGGAGSAAAPNNSVISERGKISFDNATNTIFIEETKTRLNKIRDRIQALDRPMRQVMIEARLVEVADTFFSSLGVKITNGKYGYTIGNTAGNVSFGTFTTSQTLGAGTGGSPGSLAFSLFNASQTRIVALELDAVESDAKSKTIASPKILTRDTQKATLMHGEQIPYATVSTSGTQTTFINAAITLDVTPQIQQDGRIQMNLNVTMDSRGASAGTAGFAINKRQVTTQVVVDNGGTVVVGGMYKQVDANTVERIPFLGDLPYVGFLFKNKTESKTKNELLVFITPRVVSEDLVLQQ